MSIRTLTEGDKDKQGNAECPQCGERVLIESHYGDPPKCSHCDIPYRHDQLKTYYEG